MKNFDKFLLESNMPSNATITELSGTNGKGKIQYTMIASGINAGKYQWILQYRGLGELSFRDINPSRHKSDAGVSSIVDSIDEVKKQAKQLFDFINTEVNTPITPFSSQVATQARKPSEVSRPTNFVSSGDLQSKAAIMLDQYITSVESAIPKDVNDEDMIEKLKEIKSKRIEELNRRLEELPANDQDLIKSKLYNELDLDTILHMLGKTKEELEARFNKSAVSLTPAGEERRQLPSIQIKKNLINRILPNPIIVISPTFSNVARHDSLHYTIRKLAIESKGVLTTEPHLLISNKPMSGLSDSGQLANLDSNKGILRNKYVNNQLYELNIAKRLNLNTPEVFTEIGIELDTEYGLGEVFNYPYNSNIVCYPLIFNRSINDSNLNDWPKGNYIKVIGTTYDNIDPAITEHLNSGRRSGILYECYKKFIFPEYLG